MQRTIPAFEVPPHPFTVLNPRKTWVNVKKEGVFSIWLFSKVLYTLGVKLTLYLLGKLWVLHIMVRTNIACGLLCT